MFPIKLTCGVCPNNIVNYAMSTIIFRRVVKKIIRRNTIRCSTGDGKTIISGNSHLFRIDFSITIDIIVNKQHVDKHTIRYIYISGMASIIYTLNVIYYIKIGVYLAVLQWRLQYSYENHTDTRLSLNWRFSQRRIHIVSAHIQHTEYIYSKLSDSCMIYQ